MKLPSWAGVSQTNVNVHVPENRDEMIKIILNKAAKPWYGMSDPVDTHLPAIIQPNPQTFRHTTMAVRSREKGAPMIEEAHIDSALKLLE